MTDHTRADHAVASWLTEQAQPAVPDWLGEMLEVTARTPQRPAWTIRERWVPIATPVRPRLPVTPGALRAVGLFAALLLLLSAALAVVGSRPRLPAPFGPAANGLVAYAYAGDVYTADPATGLATAIASGPTMDTDPIFSRDGTRIAFRRDVGGDDSLVVTDLDGGVLADLATPASVEVFEFSPDGTSLLATVPSADTTSLVVMPIRGSPRAIVEGMTVTSARWLPPDGREIVFAAAVPGGTRGIYIVDARGGVVRELVAARPGRDLDDPVPSPDGMRLAYMSWTEAPAFTARLRVVSLAGGPVVEPPLPDGVVWQGAFGWSNDGEWLVLQRSYTGGFERSVVAIVPAGNPSSRGIETGQGAVVADECCLAFEWAPDDTAILVTQVNQSGARDRHVLVDPTTGAVRTVPWTSNSRPTWQRRPP